MSEQKMLSQLEEEFGRFISLIQRKYPDALKIKRTIELATMGHGFAHHWEFYIGKHTQKVTHWSDGGYCYSFNGEDWEGDCSDSYDVSRKIQTLNVFLLECIDQVKSALANIQELYNDEERSNKGEYIDAEIVY